jgi:60 kDa SS-A/Ro ribonucleoprotein
MVENSAGGYTFAIDKWKRLERFLILGCETGTYYASERKLTLENAKCVQDCLAENPVCTVALITVVSHDGRAPKNDPAIFALAIVFGMGHAKEAMAALPVVCRTGTHLFAFVEAVRNFRGWGRALRRGIAAWYNSKEVGHLSYQVAKYRQRNGWSHRDLLRLAHPRSADSGHQAVYRWVTHGGDAFGAAREVKRGEVTKSYPAVWESYPSFLGAVDAIKEMTDVADIAQLIRDYNLPRECVPTQHLNLPEVWEALLEKMPLTALVRNLAKMTTVGLLKPMSKAVDLVVEKLGDAEYIRQSRLHPLALLLAGKTYSSGKGQKGHLTWEPVSAVVDALDAAFYKAFDFVEPAGKRTLLALDVSGSMDGSYIAGTNLTAREASAAMALVTARTEPHYQIVAFTAMKGGLRRPWNQPDNGLISIDISACSRLTDVVAKVSDLPFGGTDCSLPMIHALQMKWDVDTFVIYTDNETWAGSIHPIQALRTYRESTGIPAKLIVAGMTSVGFSIADPADSGMLDVVGFDSSTPAVMADFARGESKVKIDVEMVTR